MSFRLSEDDEGFCVVQDVLPVRMGMNVNTIGDRNNYYSYYEKKKKTHFIYRSSLTLKKRKLKRNVFFNQKKVFVLPI